MDNKNEKKQKENGLFISWVDLILYLVISFLLTLICVLDTVSTIDELKEKYAGINGYIIYGLWFDILWYILVIHYFYGYLFNQIIKLIKENKKDKVVKNNA
ncbi:MAG: hypothetical protein EIB84_02385 [Spiroplasma poulsonii]|uniref:Uncharacterized protein n=1 Tax=Spiroplasma poulsonii TaxID=2138 RepID=A0A0C2EJX4_9MOLU|nr:hypothetical protein [Spiroplasma poulsonii]KAF0850034.1 hypothetical protein MSROBK_021430 [Spiroplasma poulsonii]KAF0850923.1 hypothetical protein MSROBK_014060 [Spiroplasma poulsonii]KAF0851211.1 hypothetical protein MSROBK_006310 [Spiroplasma poulsonii]KAF0851384.1 hypothetical protein MSROBK_008070 [Spiroplasma poulsonii]MBW1241724.1 hypothetical protein [Spiroplasma poulsonii]